MGVLTTPKITGTPPHPLILKCFNHLLVVELFTSLLPPVLELFDSPSTEEKKARKYEFNAKTYYS